MLRLNRYLVALVLWLSFFFNIERLHINKIELVNIASPLYALIAAFTILGVALPQVARAPLWSLQLLCLPAFALVKVLYGRPYWGDGYTYLTLFELASTLLTVTLAHKVGSLTADFVETVRSVLFADTEGLICGSEEADAVIKREMQHARRSNRSLAVVVIRANTHGARVDVTATAKEIQHLLSQRSSLVALTRLLLWSLRRTDFLLDQTEQGRLVLVAPELQKTQAEMVVKRLNAQTESRLGVPLEFGVASFPEQGITFEELIDVAERNLRAELPERRVEAALAQAGD